MISGKTFLGIIPARGGSKGIHKKNITLVAGKPLIAWSILEAQKSKYLDRLILSSDNSEVIQIAEQWGCEAPFVRPAHLALDDTPGIDPVLHALEKIPGYDYVVLLQPTSPLRIAADIDGCIEKCVEFSKSACVGVSEVQKSPYWMYKIDSQDHLKPLLENDYSRRQDVPKVYSVNGSVYVGRVDWITEKKSFITGETLAYKIPIERSLDIDSKIDLLFADALLNSRQ